MKAFMSEDFLLGSETAKRLYHDYAAKMPVVDYHCHVPPREIAEDRNFENITQIMLGGDHYKWKIIRANGVDEKYITGDGSDREKFQKYAEALPRAIGNPLYHWTHLELKRYFGFEKALNGDTAEEAWNHCNKILQSGELSVKKLMMKSGVTAICTTDDPIDTLEWHQKILEDKSFTVKVVPAFRPDKAVNINKPEFPEYIAKLSQAAGMPVKNMDGLFAAISARMDFFGEMGCRASDHGLDYVVCREDINDDVEGIFSRALEGKLPTVDETEIFKTSVMLFLGRQYAKRGWVMQLHYGALRNVNTRLFERLGPDTGSDAISGADCSAAVAKFLDALNKTDELPKTVLYSLNPGDDALLAGVINCFQGTEIPGKIQHGSAWWYNDTKSGMELQMKTLANMAVLGNFIGMLTDSRSFVSYPRHEYFRRILCNMFGEWVENGEYPDDIQALGKLVQDISYNNAVRYLGLNV